MINSVITKIKQVGIPFYKSRDYRKSVIKMLGFILLIVSMYRGYTWYADAVKTVDNLDFLDMVLKSGLALFIAFFLLYVVLWIIIGISNLVRLIFTYLIIKPIILLSKNRKTVV